MTFFTLFATHCQKGTFFGLEPWWRYLPDSRFDAQCNIKDFKVLGSSSDFPLILLAIIDDLLRIAAIFALAYVLVGAVRYTASQGNPEDTAKAQSTLINALVGLAIAITAVAFVSFLGRRLGG